MPEQPFPNGNEDTSGKGYRDVFKSGTIGSEEGKDPMNPAPSSIDTVEFYPAEARDPRMHGAVAALKPAGETSVPFKSYNDFSPRVAPMPRAAQDDVYLEGYGKNAADPRMTDEDAEAGVCPADKPDKLDLYGPNRDGVLHNEGHPGFAAVQSKIEGEGYSKESAGAILASKARGASKAAHKANPRLNRVKG